MTKLNEFFLKDILKKKVFNEQGDYVGILDDLYVITSEEHSRVIAFKIRNKRDFFYCEFKDLDVFEDKDGIFLKGINQRETMLVKYSFMLREDVLNKNLRDFNTNRIFTIKDLKLQKCCGDITIVELIVCKKSYEYNSIVGRFMNRMGTLEKLPCIAQSTAVN